MSTRSLLLADDSITIQKLVNLTFAEHDYDVQTFGDGDSAMSAIDAKLPDVVLVDVNMPGRDGYSICESLRQNESSKNTPVILLVGSFEPFDAERAAQVGASTYFTKPFQSIRQVVDQVNELVASASSSSNGHAEEPGASYVETAQFSMPESEAASAPESDIDSLYSNSLTYIDTANETGSGPYADHGFDDSMIETSYLTEDKADETLDFDIVNESDEAPKFESETSNDDDPEQLVGSAYENVSNDPFQYVGTQEAQPDPIPSENFAQPSDPVSVPDAPAESPILDVPQEERAESSSYPGGPFDSFATGPLDSEPLSQIGIETVRLDDPETRSREFEELDLLDLPPIPGNETIELTTAERADLMGSNKQILSLAPELIETIVEKVVQRLSEKY